MRYYVGVRETCHQDVSSVRSGYNVEAPDEERKARELFSQDARYAFDDTKVCWKKIDPELSRFKCYLAGKFSCR
jgi:hypothetical protein